MAVLRVGAAKRHISPAADMFPLPNFSGLYEGQRPGEELTVRAIVIDNGEKKFLFEAWELADVPFDPQIRQDIEAAYGIKREDMLLSATHDHSAPFVARGPMGIKDPDLAAKIQKNVDGYTQIVKEQSMAVIADAIANMKDAKYGFGEGKSYINVSRDQYFFEGYWMQGVNWEGCSDKTLAVMKFVDENDQLIAAVLNYPMHSTTSMCAADVDGKVKVTCDAPGIACNYIEEFYGNGAIALWQASSNGDQNPYFFNIKPVYEPNGKMRYRNRLPGVAYEQGIVFGQQHGIDAIQILQRIDASKTRMKITSAEKTIELEGQKFPEGVNSGAHRIMVDNLEEVFGIIGPDDPMPEKKLVDMVPTDEPVKMASRLIMMGDVAFFTVTGETYNKTQFLLKEASPIKNLVIVNIVGKPFVSYVLDDESKDRKVFQSFMQVRPGNSDQRIVTGMLDLFDEIL